MTTIAWDGTTLAADSQATNGQLRADTKKLYRINNNVVAFCGNLVEGQELIAWFRGEGDFCCYDETTLIIVNKEELITYEGSHIPIKFKYDEPWAWGTGQHLALGALAYGADSKSAVRVAAKYDVFTGGRIVTMKP